MQATWLWGVAWNSMRREAALPLFGIPAFALAAWLTTRASSWIGVPDLLACLIVGLALGFFGLGAAYRGAAALITGPGLRVGVALLGLQLSADAVHSFAPVLTAFAVIACALMASALTARLTGAPFDVGFVVGTASGVCGVSAAIAASAVIGGRNQGRTAILIALVMAGSSLSVVVWGAVAPHLEWSVWRLGAAIGATVPDVAQAAAAGYGVSDEVGEAALVVKMTRVAMLAPFLFFSALIFRRGENATQAWRHVPIYLPFFFAFGALAILAPLPAIVVTIGRLSSDALLAMGMLAIGATTPWRTLTELGWRLPLMLGVSLVAVCAAGVGVAFLLFP